MIRLMEEADLEAVAELERICFSENWSYKLLESGLYSAYDTYYVFAQDGQVLGYCNLRILAGEGEVQRIAVRPEFRKKGIAGQLMKSMMEKSAFEKVTAISLEVRESNAPARHLYESWGFQAEAVRKGYYHNPTEDALIMWKYMSPVHE